MTNRLLRSFMALVLLTGSAGIKAKESVTWLVQDFPPTFILRGDMAGQGIVDAQLHYLLDRLGMFNNIVQTATMSRTLYQISHQDGICLAGALKTPEREKVAIFSQATDVLLGQGLFVRKSRLEDFAPFRDGSGAVDLDLLAKSTTLAGIYVPERSYGPMIDRFIASPTRIAKLRSIGLTEQAWPMLDHGHADFTFGYGVDMTYYARAQATPPDIAKIDVAGQPKYLYGHVACSKGSIGRHVIERINEVLQDAGWPLPYLQLHRRWYDLKDFAELQKAPRPD